MIRYKVVHHRRSVFAGGMYCEEYSKGMKKNAKIYTEGFFVFVTRKAAELWMEQIGARKKGGLEIIRAKVCEEGLKPRLISSFTMESDLEGYYMEKTIHRGVFVMTPPQGTECYHELEILD